MDLKGMLDSVLASAPWAGYVLAGLGSLVVLGGVYVKLTPNQDDDAWYAKLESIPVLGQALKLLKSFSPISRK